MTNFTKTIKLRFKEPYKWKEKKIRKAFEQSKKVANEASIRMPSIPNKYVRNPKAKGSPIYNIVKDLRNNGIELKSACAQQAVEKARGSYLSQCVNGNFDKPPKFEHGFVSLHNRDNIGEFFEKDGNYCISLKLFPYDKFFIPFFSGDFQDYFLERIVNGDLNYGSGEIVKYGYGYSLNLSIKKEVDLNYKPEASIGVDLD